MSVSATELRRVAPFAAMSPTALRGVASVARPRTYRRGEELFHAGDPCDSLFVVLDGFVRLARPVAGGAEVTVGIVRSGGLLGIAALLGHALHDNSAEALGFVRAVELPVPALLGLAERSPSLFAPLADLLLARLADAWADAVGDFRGAVGSQLLRVLRRLARPVPGNGSRDRMLRLAVRLSHAELARLVGAERATVTRELHALAARGTVALERGHVVGVVAAVQGTRPA